MNSNSTICLLNDSFPPLIDGVANAVTNYAEQITAQGGRAIVAAPAHPQANDDNFSYPVIRYPSVDLRKKTGYMAGIPFSPETARRISEENIALLHSHCPIVSTLLARELRQLTDAPLVLTYHTKFDIDIANAVPGKALQHGSIRALLENINACDEVWTVSKGAGENLRSLGYEGDYFIMPNGVDLPRGRVSEEAVNAAAGKYDLPDGVPVYLYVGRMMWYKGIRIILDALAKCSHDFRMVFIGDGTDRQEIEGYAQSCGIISKCVFTGSIHERESLRAWYCRADLFLFPSTFDTNGLVVREAAACFLPSVLIRGSAASEGVTDGRNGFLIDENADSLAACLATLHHQRQKVKDVGLTAGMELYLSWETAVSIAMERYRIVIDKYRCGEYAYHRKPMDKLLHANGKLMEDLGFLQKYRELNQ